MRVSMLLYVSRYKPLTCAVHSKCTKLGKVRIDACAIWGPHLIYFLAQGSADNNPMGCRLMAGQRILVPSMGVRLPPSQPVAVLLSSRPVRLAVQDAALSRRRSPVRIWYGLPKSTAACGSLFCYGEAPSSPRCTDIPVPGVRSVRR